MICYIHNPDVPKTPPAHRNKQQTYVGSFTCRFPCCFANFDDTNTSNILDFYVAFQLWYIMHPIFDALFLLKVKKACPKQPLDLAKAMKKRSTKCHIFVWEYVPNNPLARWFNCVFFLLKTLSMISSFWSIWNHTPTIGEFVNQAHIILGLPNFQYLIFLVHLKLYNLRL